MYTTLLAAFLPLMASATPLLKRAGGPTPSPIPNDCTVINPLPHAACGVGNVDGWAPTKDFTEAHQLYASYFGSFASISDQWTQCVESCCGYGDTGDCKSALLAYQVPTPAGYYGTAGGVLETACLLYDDYLTPNDFEAAEDGQYQNATAGSIYCG
jgi:hypothetical protein